MLVPDLLRRAAADAPDRVAARVDGYGEMTYADWEGRSNAVARGLTARGVDPGDRVALVFDNRAWLDYAVAYFAALKAGGVAVPLSPKLTPPEAAGILQHCEARIVVAQTEHEALAESAAGTVSAAESSGGAARVEALIDARLREEIRPTPDDAAIENLKFSECLPGHVAGEVFSARFNDPEAIATIRKEPKRVVVG